MEQQAKRRQRGDDRQTRWPLSASGGAPPTSSSKTTAATPSPGSCVRRRFETLRAVRTFSAPTQWQEPRRELCPPTEADACGGTGVRAAKSWRHMCDNKAIARPPATWAFVSNNSPRADQGEDVSPKSGRDLAVVPRVRGGRPRLRRRTWHTRTLKCHLYAKATSLSCPEEQPCPRSADPKLYA